MQTDNELLLTISQVLVKLIKSAESETLKDVHRACLSRKESPLRTARSRVLWSELAKLFHTAEKRNLNSYHYPFG